MITAQQIKEFTILGEGKNVDFNISYFVKLVHFYHLKLTV